MMIGEKILSVDKPEFEACRSVLRSGPASSLRVNIRAVSFFLIKKFSYKCNPLCLFINMCDLMNSLQVAQYASDAGYSQTASNDVDRCLRY